MPLRIAKDIATDADAISLGEAESVLVPVEVKLKSSAASGITGLSPGINALILGDIEVADFGLVLINGKSARVNIGFDATINAGGDGLFIDSDGMTILNRGTITSVSGNGMSLSGGSGAVVNTGSAPGPITFTVRNFGTVIGEKAISLTGGNVTIVNDGVLTGLGGIAIDASSISGAKTGGGSRFSNTGQIYGDVLLPTALRMDNKGLIVGDVSFRGSVIKASNAGTITGDVDFDKYGGWLINTGTIMGDILADPSKANTVGNTVDNAAGTILGAINLGGGNDVFIAGDGKVRVLGGFGVDLISFAKLKAGIFADLSDPGLVVEGPGAGTTFSSFEQVIGTGFDDTFDGTGSDTKLEVFAGAGKDTILGSKAGDTLEGGNGADTILGGAGNDGLIGGAGNDLLKGGAGDDLLNGGDGDDTIEGGTGADYYFGGNGADRFVYDASLLGQFALELITDFAGKGADDDRIDLSRVDAIQSTAKDDPFTFIGTNDFGKVAGQLRYEVKGADIYLYGDVNGDGKNDFSILMNNTVTPLVLGDFIL